MDDIRGTDYREDRAEDFDLQDRIILFKFGNYCWFNEEVVLIDATAEDDFSLRGRKE